MRPIISTHIQPILRSVEENSGCNCRMKTVCSMQNKYLTLQVVYEAEVTDEEVKIETTFRKRHRNQVTSFNNSDCMQGTDCMNCQNTYCNCKNKIKNHSINEVSLKRLIV